MYTLFIARGYPTEKYKTNGIFEFDQAKALASLKHKVIYIAIDLRSIRRWRKWGIEKKHIDGVYVYAINIPLGRVPKAILRTFKFWGLKRIYKEVTNAHGEPDIMHAHFTGFAYSAAKLKDIVKIPLVITEHSSQINKENIDNGLLEIASIAYNKADSLITVSTALAERIKDNFNIEAKNIPNIVDLSIFKYKNKTKSENLSFVSTGNLIDTKRMDLTIEAFFKAFPNNSNVTLTIFGQGPNRKALENLIEKYNLKNRIKLMGLCSREQIAEKLKTADCFVLPSQSETFGVAYIEALAMGVPVIATKCGGPEEFVNNSNGLLIDVNDKQQLINAMKYMGNNTNKYDRKMISREIRKKFSAETIGDMILNVYEEVIESIR